jgi:lysophospholipase L1-like esterase
MSRFTLQRSPLVVLWQTLIALLAATLLAACSDDSDNVFTELDQGKLVVIGDSLAAGMVDLRQFAESQRWAYPTYVANRLGMDYSVPEMAQVEVNGELRDGELDFFSIPDLRSLFNSPLVLAPYDTPLLPPVFIKQRPDEEHTNLAVPGATLAGAMNLDDMTSDIRFLHNIINERPYYDAFGGGDPLSQLDIALALEPTPTVIIVDLGANDLFGTSMQAWNPVSPDVFGADYQTLIATLRNNNPEALIIGTNVPDYFGVGNNAPTASEADQIYALPEGTVSGLLGGPAADSRFQMLPLLAFLRGDDPTAPQVITSADQVDAEIFADSYNRSIQLAMEDVGGVYIDRATFFEAVSSDGLNVTIEGKMYHLDLSYGGGLYSLDGLHPTKTLHALLANFIIEKLNTVLSMSMPSVDIDAIAATDKHVLRAIGLESVSP